MSPLIAFYFSYLLALRGLSAVPSAAGDILIASVHTQGQSLRLSSHFLPNNFDFKKRAPVKNTGALFSDLHLTAQSALAVDKDTGLILFEKNRFQIMPIASMTKLMTALVFLDTSPQWDREVVVSQDDEVKESKSFFTAGQKTKIKDLFEVGLVGSDNTAILSLIRSTGLGKESFVNRMNIKAKVLNLTSTYFAEPTGLSQQNRSTAEEIIIIAREAFKNDVIRQTLLEKETIINSSDDSMEPLIASSPDLNSKPGKSVENTNRLLFESSGKYEITGGKTGYIEQAGYCLVSQVKNYAGHEILVVVMNAQDHFARFSESEKIINWVFDNYKWQ